LFLFHFLVVFSILDADDDIFRQAAMINKTPLFLADP